MTIAQERTLLETLMNTQMIVRDAILDASRSASQSGEPEIIELVHAVDRVRSECSDKAITAVLAFELTAAPLHGLGFSSASVKWAEANASALDTRDEQALGWGLLQNDLKCRSSRKNTHELLDAFIALYRAVL